MEKNWRRYSATLLLKLAAQKFEYDDACSHFFSKIFPHLCKHFEVFYTIEDSLNV